MKRKRYRVSITGKILILQLMLSSIALLCGFTWEINYENRKWANLIYPGVMVADLSLSGKTIEEGEYLIKAQCNKLLLNKKISIVANNKTYVLDNSRLILNYDVNNAVNKAFNFGRNLTPLKKFKLLRSGVSHPYYIAFTFNESYIKDFIKSIKKDVDKEPVNASIEKGADGNIKIKADTKGYSLQESKLEEYIQQKNSSEDGENIKIYAPAQETMATITADKISCIDTNIASFNTSFLSSSFARAKNIELSIKSINGKILMPGEVFSFNDCVGERTKIRGFMEAPIIVGEKIESGTGGGICQTSSTLYNAILRAGIKPIERTHHTLPSSYVEIGLDATVDWNDIDFKFKNTLGYPIYIEGYTSNSNLYVNIYSNSILAKRKYAISSNEYETIQPDTEILDDPNLPEGQTSVIQNGYKGYKVKVTSDAYENGIVIKTETISNDLYPPVPSIIGRGIKTNR